MFKVQGLILLHHFHKTTFLTEQPNRWKSKQMIHKVEFCFPKKSWESFLKCLWFTRRKKCFSIVLRDFMFQSNPFLVDLFFIIHFIYFKSISSGKRETRFDNEISWPGGGGELNWNITILYTCRFWSISIVA